MSSSSSPCLKTGLQCVNMPMAGIGSYLSPSGEDVEKSVEMALEAGVRLIDTATAYMNEASIGKVFKRWIDSGTKL
jgi:diketogulonate reductase-like aldo/keto reductase